MTPRNEVAIYSPYAFTFYEGGSGDASEQHRAGGAELQTTLLARGLARMGWRVAHIIYPVETMAAQPAPAPEPVQLPARRRARRDLLGLRETLGVWRALRVADARLYVFRTGLSGAIVIGAAFCLLHRRRLVLAGSSDLDFIFDRPDRSRLRQALYRLALKRTDHIVVQSEQQRELAREAVGSRDHADVTLIPSFAESAKEGSSEGPPPDPDAFLWAGRLVDYKQPLLFTELARALPATRFRMVAPTTGDTSDALERRLVEEAAALENLELIERMRRDRLLALIGRAIAVVSTSRYEGMPNVFLEAWSRGVPVISLHFDPDGRIDGERLGVCAHGSWERFLAAARRLQGDPALRAELGENGRRYVARTHSVDAVEQRWAATLRKVSCA